MVQQCFSAMPSNAEVIYCELKNNGEYSSQVTKQNKKYNIIIIDGRDRVSCIKHSINRLSDDGVIVFDNSNLSQYSDGNSFLIEKGFRKIDFWGLSPVTGHNNCTSIFYKHINCLGI